MAILGGISWAMLWQAPADTYARVLVHGPTSPTGEGSRLEVTPARRQASLRHRPGIRIIPAVRITPIYKP